MLAACQPVAGPALVQVTGTMSSRLREGDVLELRGDAFPEGRTAEVTLRGEVFRAGSAPSRKFQVSLPGRSVSTHTVAVDVTRPVERAFSGTTDPLHASFHGSIEVSFAPRVAGTPPVTGVLPDVRLDFIPAEGNAASVEARREDGLRFADFVGVLLDESGAPFVAGVMPGSAAERAGVARGDRLLSMAGVSVLGVEDLVPPPRARQVELVVDGSATSRRTLVLDVAGFRPVSPREWGLAAGMLAGALALLALVVSPFGRALSFVEHRLGERLRQNHRIVRPRGTPAARRSLLVLLVTALPSGAGTYVVFAATSAMLAAFVLGIPLVSRELDLPLFVLASFTALMLATLVFGSPGEERLAARVRRAALVLTQAFVVFAALTAAGLVVGSFGADALSLAQGPWPWQWLAFRGPVTFGATLLAFAALVPEAARERSPDAVPRATRAVPARRELSTALAGQTVLLLGSGVLALICFGGGRVPWGAASLVPSAGAALTGVLVVLAKTWSVAFAVAGVRWALGRVDIDDVRAFTLRVFVPASLVLVGLAVLARQPAIEHALALGERGLGAACLAGWFVVAVALAHRLRPRRVALEAERGPNPWL